MLDRIIIKIKEALFNEFFNFTTNYRSDMVYLDKKIEKLKEKMRKEEYIKKGYHKFWRMLII